ncbi:MAG: hypothetical protein ABGX07_07620 [Pirellulaceae bacterium]|nr:hypothetical protein [Planctomycetota bacterium]
MWCIECEEDVTAIGGDFADAIAVCPHCTSQLVTSSHQADDVSTNPNSSSARSTGERRGPLDLPTTPPMHWDDWQLDADADELQRLLEQFDAMADVKPQEAGQADPPSSPLPVAATTMAPAALRLNRRAKSARTPWFAWLVFSGGLMLFVCGSVLSIWSWVAGRGELWVIGVPITLAGGASLLISFVLQLESLWSGHRETLSMLNAIEERMAELRHTTAMLNTSHSGASHSFYSHMADGASPHLMLADLKSQLDLLAVQMSRENQRAA